MQIFYVFKLQFKTIHFISFDLKFYLCEELCYFKINYKSRKYVLGISATP
jgi:hypothetical protein